MDTADRTDAADMVRDAMLTLNGEGGIRMPHPQDQRVSVHTYPQSAADGLTGLLAFMHADRVETYPLGTGATVLTFIASKEWMPDLPETRSSVWCSLTLQQLQEAIAEAIARQAEANSPE